MNMKCRFALHRKVELNDVLAITWTSSTLQGIHFLSHLLPNREIKSDRRMIHVNLFVALFFANAVLLTSQVTSRAGMLIGIDDAEGDKTYPACIVLTFFNHFLLLTAMFWMLIEGIVIYRWVSRGNNIVVLSMFHNPKAWQERDEHSHILWHDICDFKSI